MTTRTAPASPQIYARIGGILYLIIIVLGAVGELSIRGRIIVSRNAAATAANLKSMESLWRFGIASEMFLGICTIALALILYVLLRPVNRDLALLATFFSLIAIAVEIAYSLQLVEALYPLGNAAYLKAFTPEQFYAMSSLSIKAHGDGFGIALLFFGCFFPIAGFTSMPRLFEQMILGPRMSKAGGKQIIGQGMASTAQENLLIIKELLETGKVVPVIDRRYPLRETAEAIRYLEEGRAKGKVVITVV